MTSADRWEPSVICRPNQTPPVRTTELGVVWRTHHHNQHDVGTCSKGKIVQAQDKRPPQMHMQAKGKSLRAC